MLEYETYSSTLKTYPDTLLGTMFHERNNKLLQPTNNNEYFFDRDSQIFRYIMQYYQTSWNFHETINITFYATPLHHETLPTDKMMYVSPFIEKIHERLKQYESSGYKILELFSMEIKNYLEKVMPKYTLNIQSSYHKHYYHPNYTGGSRCSHAQSLIINCVDNLKNLKYDILEKSCLNID
ncbi:11613_t:CDS:2 [Diversispora eburnea]|uniref:11613_t:CDS:1 n=1 Tax=Diversispora eburnea TaxID=1213867 RepID=A0A9N9G2S8_9GLOM|nr:11613_t:CDS:2 [Diversispora eburnea]